MINSNPISLDLWKKNIAPIMLTQGETDGRKLRFLISSGGVALSPTGVTVTFFLTKPDATVVFATATHDGTYFVVNISTQMVAVSGDATAEFEIVSATAETVRSVIFDVTIEPTSDISTAVESSSAFPALEEALATVTAYDSRIGACETDIGTLETDVGTLETAIGAMTFTEDNYIADGDTVTEVADKLDMALKDTNDAIGTRIYTEHNYVTDGESATDGINDLDMALKDHADLSLLTGTVHGLAVTAGSGNLTPTSETGTLTTATGTYAYYRVGKMLTYHIYVSIVDKGTGDGALDVSGLPINFNARTCGTGVDSNTGVPLRIYTTTSGVMRIYRYDNTSAVVTGATLSLDITGITA